MTYVCAECGQADYFHCPRGTPSGPAMVSIWCSSDGPKPPKGRKRRDIPLAEWEIENDGITMTAIVPTDPSDDPQLDFFSDIAMRALWGHSDEGKEEKGTA